MCRSFRLWNSRDCEVVQVYIYVHLILKLNLILKVEVDHPPKQLTCFLHLWSKFGDATGKVEVEDRYTHLLLCRSNNCICWCSGNYENQVTEGGEIMAEILIMCLHLLSGNGSSWRQAIYQCDLHYFFSVIITLVDWDEIILLLIIWFEYHAINSGCLAYSVWMKALILLLVNISWEVYCQLWNIGPHASLNTPMNMIPVVYEMYDQVESNVSRYTVSLFGTRQSVNTCYQSHTFKA